MFFVRMLAELILVVHFGFILFVVLGLLLIVVGGLRRWQWVRNPWFRLAHLAAISIVVMETAFQVECPLTKWERELLVYAGDIDHPENIGHGDWNIENEGLIARTIRDIMMCDRDVGPVLVVCYYAFGGLVLATLLLIPPRLRRKVEPAAAAAEPTPVAKT